MVEKGKRRFIFFIVAIVFFLAISFFWINGNSSGLIIYEEKNLEEVSLRMSWIPSTEFAPLVLAQDKGFYAEEGLKVNLLESKGSSLATSLLASGTDDFGMVTGNIAFSGITKGMPLKVVSVLFQKSPSSVFYFRDSGINVPKDLEGKKISSDPASTKRQEFIVFAKENNVDLDKIGFIPASGTSQEMAGLMDRNADAALGFLYLGKPILEANGFNDFDYMLFDDFGVNIYSKSIITHNDLIERNPELVRRFVKATNKGWEYSADHPEEAVEVLVKRYPEMNEELELEKLKLMLTLTENEVTKQNGFGYMTKERWEEMQDFLFDQEVIDTKIDVTTMFTNEFLE